jgi:hypothetical protein
MQIPMKIAFSTAELWLRVVIVVALTTTLETIPLQSARAGGPPLITDDPETPGDGNWEINFATITARTARGHEITAPDLDINYGWGERIQLKADFSWLVVHPSGQSTKSGLNISDFGVKWRFVDQENAGFSLSIYPQLAINLSPSSTRRGLTDPGRELFLPLEGATKIGSFELGAEIGRNLIENAPDEWLGGFVIAHACGQKLECVAEIHGTAAEHFQTLVNFGVHWELGDALVLLAAAGRDIGPRGDDRQEFSCYFGLQVLR